MPHVTPGVRPHKSAAFLTVALALLLSLTARAETPAVNFNRDVQPILADNCYACHGPDEKARKAKLRLDTRDGAFRVTDNKAVITPGKPADSELIRRVTTHDDDNLMPPPDSRRSLTPQEILTLKTWVEQGANWGTHWSFTAPTRPPLPEVHQKGWPKSPIDHFVLARLESEHLTPSPDAPKHTLIRRVTLDLTGLPPTPAEVAAFEADPAPDAYEKVVDRLLASPRYGERMVWEWLDAARYADTNGYQGDNVRTMWPWRDWVVAAMNANMPFDQFTIQQLAGDLLPNATEDQKLATAFNRNHMINGEGGRIAAENRVDYVMDQTEATGTVWLGLTVGCARCHDHKFDPILQKEYYQLFAFFNNSPVDGGGGNGQTAPVIDFASPDQKAKVAALEADVKKLADELATIETSLFPRDKGKPASDSPAAAKLSGNIVNALKQSPEKRSVDAYREIVNFYKAPQPKYADLAAKVKAAMEARNTANVKLPRVMVMQDLPKPRETFVLTKGAYDKPTDTKVTANTPAALPPIRSPQSAIGNPSAPPIGNPQSAIGNPPPPNRLDLAKWLVSQDHPLTSRVTVNRYWQQFFGTGLVKTVDDFGVQGEKPSHPDLLDYLATEFKSNWDVKSLHRLIVTSATYRQSSRMTPDSYERDPENRLLSRGPRYRLPVFAIRDQALAAAGLLVDKPGGPPVKGYQPPGIWEEATFGQIRYEQDHGEALYRRSLYQFWRRIVGPTMFFDTASRQTCTVKTPRTNTPLHALTLLNDTTYVEAARALAQRILTESPTPQSRLELAYNLLLARKPTTAEQSVLLAALTRLQSQYADDKPAAQKLLATGESKRDEKLDPSEHAAYTGLCTILLNLDETLNKE